MKILFCKISKGLEKVRDFSLGNFRLTIGCFLVCLAIFTSGFHIVVSYKKNYFCNNKSKLSYAALNYGIY